MWNADTFRYEQKLPAPFTITSKIVGLIAETSQQLAVLNEQKSVRLGRINRVRAIRSSLAIEGKTLNEAQIIAILDGKRFEATLPTAEIEGVSTLQSGLG